MRLGQTAPTKAYPRDRLRCLRADFWSASPHVVPPLARHQRASGEDTRPTDPEDAGEASGRVAGDRSCGTTTIRKKSQLKLEMTKHGIQERTNLHQQVSEPAVWPYAREIVSALAFVVVAKVL